MPAYRAGRRPTDATGPVYSLASNESPYPPSPAVLAAIAAAAEESHRYPDPANSALVAALAAKLGVAPQAIGLGTGSVALCQQVVTAAAGPGDEVVFAWRSFEAYPIITQAAGATAVKVPLGPGGRHDLAAMAGAVTDRTRVVFLCTPNNPTGPAIGGGDLADFLRSVGPELLVVIDEAYHEYLTDPDAADSLAAARSHRNVVLLRTLSKAYGLAGLRVGYAVGDPDLMTRLRPVALPFGVSRVAEAAGVAALAEPDVMSGRVGQTIAERQRVLDHLLEQGWTVPHPQGNFVWLPLGDQSDRFSAVCAEQGFTVRCFPGEGVRVTIAEPAANDAFLHTAAAWTGRHGEDGRPG